MKSGFKFTICFIFSLLLCDLVLACPNISGLTDLNCDQQLVIVTFGDSITFGRGDSTGLGYPGRLNLIHPPIKVVKLGVPGEDTDRGKVRSAKQLPLIPEADYTIILEGVNDYFVASHTVDRTKSNLASIVRTARSPGSTSALSTLTDIKRTSAQVQWVKNINSAIRSFSQLEFYSLGKSIISGDKLHPDDLGYQRMAEYVSAYLIDLSTKNKPADLDADGVFDFAEPKFGTSSNNSDSDGDGISDGQELFTYKSNPTILDSDADGISDHDEVFIYGSDPASALPGPPTVKSITPIALTNP
jgi:lysophospholipase L1-like esterase